MRDYTDRDLTGTITCATCGYLLSKRLHDCCIEQLEAMKPEKAPEEPALIEEPTLIEEEKYEVILEEEEAPEEVVEEEESDDDDEDLEAYLEELPVKELKKLCGEADLSKKGKKADLVARLLE